MAKAKVKKYKLKPHKATKKVLNIRQSGSITKLVAGNNHQTGKKSAKQSRRAGSKSEFSKADMNRLKNVL